MTTRVRRFKRVADSVTAVAVLLLAWPLMLAIAIAIKLDSAGPVLFRQPRQGFNGAVFGILKFRTMFHGARDTEARRLTRRGDPRVTRVGAVLRRTSLDELPQLFNVLRGEMSIVGPRPHAPGARAAGVPYRDAVPGYSRRHCVRPGITGWAQVNGWRGETDTLDKIRRRVACDLEYIDSWSPWLDLRILLMTSLPVAHRNAY